MKRVGTIGLAGAGKTTFSRALSRVSGLPYYEVDELFHGPQWERNAAFERDVRLLASQECWIAEVHYRESVPILAPRVDVLFVFDLPFWLTYMRLVRRTLLRRLLRTKLWNENVQGPVVEALWNRDHLLRWALRQKSQVKQIVSLVLTHNPCVEVIWFHRRGDARSYIRHYANRQIEGE